VCTFVIAKIFNLSNKSSITQALTMGIATTLFFGVVYFAGYYGGHLINLLTCRVLISNLRICGLIVLAATAVLMALLIQLNLPATASAKSRGYAQAYFVMAPAILVACCVIFRMWRESQRRYQVKKYGA
jgi:uncharacterized membrane protein